MGYGALKYADDRTAGEFTANTAVGYNALRGSTTASNNTGLYNTGNGFQTLLSNTIGESNTAVGALSMEKNTSGNYNSAIGYSALYNNANGNNNTALGFGVLLNNISGSNNTAVGQRALRSNNASNMTAVGVESLYSNTTGNRNTAMGYQTLRTNTTGFRNTAYGEWALFSNTVGNSNTASGIAALYNNTSGTYNTAHGYNALSQLTTGTNNLGLGFSAQVPNAAGSNQVRIGNTSISYAGVQVGWTITSDQRWKDHIRKLPYGLDLLMQLKPVDYIRKNNEHQTREIGFIAQDLKVLLEAVGYQDQGLLTADDDGFMSVRYNDFIPLIVNAVQEQQETIETLKAENTQLKDMILQLQNIEQRLSTLENTGSQINEVVLVKN
ncbi:tail fiber domain-containing protein [Paucihalobacter sp.]|uniref:tail fiber domain-containing protein n=1 Tax=Paucihalobacter sp. TaxID=2850405 RepID=UPI003D1622EC